MDTKTANTNGITDAEVADQLDSIALNELRQSHTSKRLLKDAARIIRAGVRSEQLTREEAADCAVSVRAALNPAGKMFIPRGWNVLLEKLDAIARQCERN